MLMPMLSLSRRLVEAPTHGWSGAVAAGICAALIAGCGSSTKPKAAAASGGPLLKDAECMRAHGVPNFPDPRASGGLVIPNNINTESPGFKAAEQACASLAGPNGGGPAAASRKLQFLAIARCMRSHGVPSFADPTSSPPPPSSGNAIGGNGWFLALGTTQERQSPAYQRAAATCGANIR
jgi:hypothetical protein